MVQTHPRRPHGRRWFSSEQHADIETFSAELTRLKSSSEGGLEALLASNLSSSTRAQILEDLSLDIAKLGPRITVAMEPSWEDLKMVALTNSIPFVGFGFLDNAILIIAGKSTSASGVVRKCVSVLNVFFSGDAIDTSLGVTLGISTMCAAAIGNIISDVAGIMLGTVIEDFCTKYLNLPVPNLTTAQRQLRSVRFANQFGCGVGIVIGCIIGMFPLWFIDSNKIQARKRERHLDSIFRDVITEAGSLIGAQRTCLFLVVDKPADEDQDVQHPVPTPDGKFLYAKYDAVSHKRTFKSDRYIPLGRGIVSRAALTGEAWNIYDVPTEPDYTPEMGGHDSNEKLSDEDQIHNMVCVPVLDAQGRAIAVIQAINKVRKGQMTGAVSEAATIQAGFTPEDVQVLKALASHISVSLGRMTVDSHEDEDVRLRDTIKMLKKSGLQGIADRSKGQRKLPLFPED